MVCFLLLTQQSCLCMSLLPCTWISSPLINHILCYSVYRLCVILCTVCVLFCVPFMYYSVYCLCIILCTVYVYSVYSVTATGCQPICSLLIIIIFNFVSNPLHIYIKFLCYILECSHHLLQHQNFSVHNIK